MNKKDENRKIEIDKTKEPRKPGISQMIDEGGLGAEKYYEIKKQPNHDKEKNDEEK